MKKTTRAQEIRVGAAAVLALLALVGGILWGRGVGMRVSGRTITMQFDEVSGLGLGAPVTWRGVRMGTVTDIAVRPTGVRVQATVENGLPLRRDAKAEILSAEITGGRSVSIAPGNADELLPPGAVIPGFTQPSVASLLENAGTMSEQATRLLTRIDSTVASVQRLVEDPTLRDNLRQSATDLASAASASRSLVDGNRQSIEHMVNQLTTSVARLHDLVADASPTLRRAINATADATDDARSITKRAGTTVSRVDSVVAHADVLLSELTAMVDSVRNGKGVAGRLIGDEEFARKLERTLDDTQALIRNIQRNGVNLNIGLGRRP